VDPTGLQSPAVLDRRVKHPWSADLNFSTVLANKLPIMNQTPTTREARLKAEYRGLYPQLEPGVWTPAAKITERVLAVQGALKVGSNTRSLSQHHFEFRGSSPREPGGPTGLSRSTDVAAPEHTADQERAEREQRLAAREREADQGIQQGEELQARVDQVTEDIERLRRKVDRTDADAGSESADREPKN
jgi:hypothetical protein